MGKRIYLTDAEMSYLRNLLDAQDPHDMLGELEPETSHYETSRISISKKIKWDCSEGSGPTE